MFKNLLKYIHLPILSVLIANVVFADPSPTPVINKASQVTTVTGSFNNNLSASDNTVQKALDTLDNMSSGGIVTGAASTIISTDLTVSTALISNAAGKVAVKLGVSDVELGYLDGVTSAIQTQINSKGTGTGTVGTGTARAFAYYPASDTTIDDNAIVFTDNTNVGIGTSSPRTKLEVFNTMSVSNQGRLGVGTTAPSARLELSSTGTSKSALVFKISSATPVQAVAVTNFGMVGIGTITPTAKLSIVGTTSLATSQALNVSNGSLVVADSGFVGIGTTAASGALSINGTLNFTGSNAITRAGAGIFSFQSTAMLFNSSRNNMDFSIYGQNLNDVFYSDASANRIGIGTSTPTAKLEIAGTVVISGSSGKISVTSTADIGWSIVAVGNQACNTTCTNACVAGLDQGTLGAVLPSFVGCTDATADQCICAGAN